MKKAPEFEQVAPTVSGKEEEKARRKEKRQAFKEKVKNVLRVLIDNKFVVKKKSGEELFRMPIIVLILCALAVIWLTVIALIVGLLFGLRYSFEGKELGTKAVNDGITKVSEYTKDIVNNITGKKDSEQTEDVSGSAQTENASGSAQQ